MRKGLLFLTSAAAFVSLVACSSAERRSGFDPGAETGEDSRESFKQDEPVETPDGAGCSATQTEIARIPVVIEFVVDESGSMSGDKWKAQSEALQAAFEDMKDTADPSTFFGIQMFHDALGQGVKPGSLLDPDQFDKIMNVITSSSPTGSTGTEKALKAGYGVLETFKPPASTGLDADQMKRALVLLSDGQPDGGKSEQQRCEDLAQEKFGYVAPDGPIPTFSVGIGNWNDSSYDPAFMSRMALAGGTADPTMCDPTSKDEFSVCHFQITPKSGDYTVAKQKLIDAINAIRALTASCEFSFTITQDADLSKTEVTITDADGNVTNVPADPENGWSFDDEENPTKVVLNGDACSASNGTVSGRVDVVLGCKGAW